MYPIDIERMLSAQLTSDENRLLEISVESGIDLSDLKKILAGKFPPDLNQYSTLMSLARAIQIDYMPIATSVFIKDLINLQNLNYLINKNKSFEELLKFAREDDRLFGDLIEFVKRYKFENC